MKGGNRGYIPEIDEIRGLAALLVLFYHGFQLIGAELTYGRRFNAVSDWIIANNPVIAVIEEGHTGVGLFIVLSGFILSTGSINRDINYRGFILARVLRIYPIYIALLVAAALVGNATLPQFFSSLIPLPIGGGVQGAFTSMFWAVKIEMLCYLAFPFVLKFTSSKGLRYIFALVALILIFRCIAVFGMAANPRDISYWTILGRLDQFLIGVILAHIIHARPTVSENMKRLFPLIAGIIVLILWGFNRAGGWIAVADWKIIWPVIEGVMWAAFIASYLPFFKESRIPGKGLLRRFGEISYSVYMIHFSIIYLAINTGLMIRLTGYGYYDALVTTAIVVLPLSLLAGILLNYTLEKPFLEMRPKYLGRHSSEVTSQPIPAIQSQAIRL